MCRGGPRARGGMAESGERRRAVGRVARGQEGAALAGQGHAAARASRAARQRPAGASPLAADHAGLLGRGPQ
jgi:hypothetical protein